jgi:hypothetical protein
VPGSLRRHPRQSEVYQGACKGTPDRVRCERTSKGLPPYGLRSSAGLFRTRRIVSFDNYMLLNKVAERGLPITQ